MKTIRKTQKVDIDNIYDLYKKTASTLGGLARYEDEITKEYISSFVTQSMVKGLSLVIEKDNHIIGEIHAYSPGLKVFNHILSDLTICIHPDYQGQQYGKKVFSEFMKIVKIEMQDIKRVELITRESNTKAINFYKNTGFMVEGCLKNRIDGISNDLENDIPMAWLRNS